jgi:SAM-dependent methyltransferase
MLDGFQYGLLKTIAPTDRSGLDGSAYSGKSKLRTLLGNEIFEVAKGKVVIDFGCGTGQESVELAKSGARLVIGMDIQEEMLSQARQRARLAGVQDRCVFSTTAPEPADVIISLDSFEHFSDPSGALSEIWGLLKPGGCMHASFGPTWYHPLGGHLFSVFPWAHLIFSENALIRWRKDIRNDGARSFAEVAGGLNQMTIARFLDVVRRSEFEVVYMRTVPIRRVSLLHNRFTREFTTSIVQCKLYRPCENTSSYFTTV